MKYIKTRKIAQIAYQSSLLGVLYTELSKCFFYENICDTNIRKIKCEHIIQVHGNHSGINGESPDMHSKKWAKLFTVQYEIGNAATAAAAAKASYPIHFVFLGSGKRGEVDVATEGEQRVRLPPLSYVKWQFSFEKIEQTNKKQSQSKRERKDGGKGGGLGGE